MMVLASTSEEWETRVRKAFGGLLNGELRRDSEACAAEDARAAVQAVLSGDPQVVVLGPGLEMRDALGIAHVIDEERHEVCVVLVADATPELWQHALRAGVRDVVAPDAALVEVRATLERALDTSARRRTAGPTALPGVPKSKVLAVVSPKGGAGKTAIATNLAVGLARQEPNEVVVVDLDVQFGDVAHALRLTPEVSVADAARALGALDETSLKAYLTPHPAGLFVLCAPDHPAAADGVEVAHVGKILDLLAGVFRYVVIDTSAGLDEITLSAMEHATDIVVVCATDVASARGARKELDAFDQLGFTRQQRHFVLNRADARVGLDVRDIEATVGLPVDVFIPSSRAVPVSMNQGSPLLEQDQRAPVSRAFNGLVDRFVSVPNSTTAAAPAGALRRRRKEHR